METLISKKDLLNLTKISYGQLYRWKRMNIIPEDWFIKKATPTGQETFFEREKILERIEFVLSKKDDVSLEDIASLLNRSDHEYVEVNDDIEDEVISQYTKDVFYSLYDEEIEITEKEMLIMSIIQHYLVKSIITLDELKLMLPVIEEHFSNLLEEDSKIILYRKFGVSFVVGCKKYKEVVVDSSVVKVAQVDIKKELATMQQQ